MPLKNASVLQSLLSGMNTVDLGRVEQGQTSFSSSFGKKHSWCTVVLCTVLDCFILLVIWFLLYPEFIITVRGENKN